jgi:hypothetical protein
MGKIVRKFVNKKWYAKEASVNFRTLDVEIMKIGGILLKMGKIVRKFAKGKWQASEESGNF